jgi:putative peptidoglycan lipid II flippase
MDAYLIALAVPGFAITVFPASFVTALMPTLVSGRGVEAARAALGFAAFGGAILTIALAVCGRPILKLAGYGLDDARLQTALTIYYILLPILFFTCITATLSAIANAARRFGMVAALPAISVATAVIAVWWGTADWGIYALAAGVTLGAALETIAIAWFVARVGLAWQPTWQGMTRRLADALVQTRPLILAAALAGGATLVDQAMASTLAHGDVAILGYGTRLGAVLATLAGTLAIAALPYFSTLAVAGDWAGMRRTLLELTALALAATAIVAAVIMLASADLIRILFQRGSFTAEDTVAAAWVQTMFAVHLPFYVLTNLALRAIAALERNAVAMWIALLFFAVNAIADWLLMRSIGAAGIALATAVAYALAALAAYIWLLRELAARRSAT